MKKNVLYIVLVTLLGLAVAYIECGSPLQDG